VNVKCLDANPFAFPAKFFAEWAKDAAGLQRVTHEVWQMKKLDLAKLQKAFAGK